MMAVREQKGRYSFRLGHIQLPLPQYACAKYMAIRTFKFTITFKFRYYKCIVKANIFNKVTKNASQSDVALKQVLK